MESQKYIDVQLFSELSYWLVQRMEQPTYENYLNWLGQWATGSPELRLRLIELLRLTDPKTKEAEDALREWLGRDHVVSRRRKRVSESIDNHVDWTRTWAMKEGDIPYPYHTQRRAPFAPYDLENALAGLARRWCQRLDIFSQSFSEADGQVSLRVDLKGRANKLRSVRRRGYAPYTSRHAQHLLKMGGEHRELALKIREVERFLEREIRSKNDPLIAIVAQYLEQAAKHDSQLNVNDLLEATATIAIAKAATDVCPELLISVGAPSKRGKGLHTKKPDIFLEWPSGLTCTLHKGYPREDEAAAHTSTDLLRPTFERWGLTSSGLEPDIVLTFRHHQRPGHPLTHLGDAKRTMKEDGGYVRASIHNAVRYVIAYQRELKAQVHPDARLFTGPLQPLYTLFVFAPKDTRPPTPDARNDDWLHIHYLGVDFGPGEMCSQGLRTWMQKLTTRAECYFDGLGDVQRSQYGV